MTRQRTAFFGVAAIVVWFLAAAGAPTPLYVVYQHEWHFSAAWLTFAFAVYAGAVLEPALEAEVPPGYITDLEQTMRGIARIKRSADHVLPMHDRGIRERYADGVQCEHFVADPDRQEERDERHLPTDRHHRRGRAGPDQTSYR